jgi:antitoxin ParD1/3/4
MCDQEDRVSDREARLSALREMLNRSIADGGEVTDAELDAALDAEAARLAKEGL